MTLDDVQVLRDVSLSVKQSQAVALIGPNGAGKTVFFRALLGLVPHTGTVVWRPGIKIGYVPQRFTVDRSAPITAMEFFLLQAKNFWKPATSLISHIDDELVLVGLDKHVLDKGLGQLSGGETQRVLIAWALLGHPDVLLLDEPTAGVDIGFEHSVYELLHRIQTERGTALLLISHDINVVYRYTEHVVCLNRTVLCQGRPLDTLTPTALKSLYGESAYYLHDHSPEH